MANKVPDNFHALYDRGFRAARGALPTQSALLETAGHERLAADVPDFVVDYDEATRLPNRVVSRRPTARLAARSGDSPEDAVVQFIHDRGALWNLAPEDAGTVEVVSVSQKGLNTVNLIQRIEGKEVFNSDVTAAVGPDNDVISVAGQLFPGATAARSRARAAATISEEEAIARAAFDYKYDHSQPASAPQNLQNSLVGMFYHVNWLHDRWYEAGFDEASGNAQRDNFGRGGIGGDPILAEGNDHSGTDNANMSLAADGDSPVMQMYEFKGPKPLPGRTSNYEALITFHEMGYYVTNRLAGIANGLTNRQGEAMGEGWGDFFAICMTSHSTDDFENGVFAAGGWTDLTPTFKNNYYFSIRRYPYTADMSKNLLTFKHISGSVVLPMAPSRNPNAGDPTTKSTTPVRYGAHFSGKSSSSSSPSTNTKWPKSGCSPTS